MLNSENVLLALNDIQDEYIESARTMLGYKVGERNRTMVKKRIVAFALAATLVLSLGIAAYAAYVRWSRGIEQKLPAMDAERQLAEESGLSDTSQTVSSNVNGVTISVEQTVIDNGTANIALRIEGCPLDEAQARSAMLWNRRLTFDGETAPASGGSFVEECGANNRTSVIAADGSMEYDIWANAGDKLDTLAGKEICITIESLGLTSGKGGQYQALVEGPWELKWTPNSNSEVLAVNVSVPIGDTGLQLLSAEIGSVSAKVSLKLDKPWDGYQTLEFYDWQLAGVRLKDGTVLTNIFSAPTQEGYADIDNLVFEMHYSSNRILLPSQIDALVFAANSPWARTLDDGELVIIPIA